jgi:alkanesulfonate monooxygenase SsuD/methylene tetrahydromethanopterin reductase-like flavin-dependent oxidoreductase (luciferase family)
MNCPVVILGNPLGANEARVRAIAARGFTDDERPIVEGSQRKALVGTAAQVGTKLRALAASLGLDELVVNTWAHDPRVRRHSYALLAHEFALLPVPTAA